MGPRQEGILKSSEFDTLCAKKAVAYVRVGFEGCVAQFRANDYSEEEHPTPFLDAKKALMEMPDDEEEADAQELREKVPVRNWALVLGGVATRGGASAELGFKCRAGRAYVLGFDDVSFADFVQAVTCSHLRGTGISRVLFAQGPYVVVS
ncbi:hypothetical protein F511_39165 [Dorcoceras hygrometricum]|uniref:Uncharacterized protein n=1 Tax=Dorcoceras hygrometricum TaxID=472368 RepID=A0A2Z7B2G0_9LAMI|nr:hypothetical protein F511_39165 [Dorcoceras hygrometricum]